MKKAIGFCTCIDDYDARKLSNFTENMGISVFPVTLSVEARSIKDGDSTELKIWNMRNIKYRISVESVGIGKDTCFWLHDEYNGKRKILPNTKDTFSLKISPETNTPNRLKIFYSIK